MPDPSERQLLADSIRGELLLAYHGTAEVDELVARVLACIDAHPPHAALLRELDDTKDRLADLEAAEYERKVKVDEARWGPTGSGEDDSACA